MQHEGEVWYVDVQWGVSPCTACEDLKVHFKMVFILCIPTKNRESLRWAWVLYPWWSWSISVEVKDVYCVNFHHGHLQCVSIHFLYYNRNFWARHRWHTGRGTTIDKWERFTHLPVDPWPPDLVVCEAPQEHVEGLRQHNERDLRTGPVPTLTRWALHQNYQCRCKGLLLVGWMIARLHSVANLWPLNWTVTCGSVFLPG